MVKRVIVVVYLGLLVLWPVGLVVANSFADGADALVAALSDPVVVNALWLTVQVAVVSVVINTVFGIGVSLLLVRHRFPGRWLLSVLIDLPLSVSPVVVGLAIVLVYGGVDGWFGPTLEAGGLQVVFAAPGMVMATVFVALPLVIREVVPVLREIGDEQEQAARTLGATGWQVFARITLPAIRWAVVYGVVLSLARSLGEFGAVKIVSGNLINRTQTATLVVEQKYQDFEQTTAYATAFLLAFAAVLCLVVVSVIRPKEGS
ncbi:sulfate ABC transporter permease subunit [Actinokineospora fastidiosa]|uniref:Sulfate ABC transporter permease subunit CysW n=1 Tax=Actinokineospora fastidiosa TaxID=1816 RepID=A0A918GI04_9PSEU|nr:sulfate ABC transporter permease subunit [Actinokineospora fastidiosa]GGS36524.1 sulfate ABC transporter permease subunit CysW [Actinokineospora fastidiosa]